MARFRGVSACALLALIAPAPVVAGPFWPLPQSANFAGSTLTVDSKAFTFIVTGADSAPLQDAITRYDRIAFVQVPATYPSNSTTNSSGGVMLSSLAIDVASPSLNISLQTSENYTLTIPAAGGQATLTADTFVGAIRGLETFAQLLDWVPGSTLFTVPAVAVVDFPRFAWRGALLDTARHWLPLPTIYGFIDALAYNKMNVFHWHIVDDQSFPFYSQTFPNISFNGAWNAPANPGGDWSHIYSPQDVKDVIQYASFRGIRVVPEFDTPGHSLSWGKGVPGLLTQCYNTTTNQPIPGSFGPIDPTLDTTWTFLAAFFKEVVTVFPDAYVHVGGDEVTFDCWQSNPQITAWMAANNVSNYDDLESYYVQRVLNIVDALDHEYVGWQEIFDNNLTLRADTVVHAWKNPGSAGLLELAKITAAGYKALLSAGWYLNYIAYGVDWPPYYLQEPYNFTGTDAQKALVMGGELAMWGEYVDATNLISRMWPRGSAVAERLWSAATVRDIADAEYRLHAHRCRLISRGLAAEPANGPNYCPFEWQPAYNPPWAN